MRKKLILVLFFLFAVISCKSGEMTPIVDRTYLEYENTLTSMLGSDSFSIRYDFEEVGKDHFRVKIRPSVEPRVMKVDLGDEAEVIVDSRFRDDHGAELNFMQMPLWIASSKRREGGYVMGGQISKVEKWTDWEEVCVLTGALIPGRWYYEKKTGLLVGGEMSSFGSGWQIRLKDHNVWGL